MLEDLQPTLQLQADPSFLSRLPNAADDTKAMLGLQPTKALLHFPIPALTPATTRLNVTYSVPTPPSMSLHPHPPPPPTLHVACQKYHLDAHLVRSVQYEAGELSEADAQWNRKQHFLVTG